MDHIKECWEKLKILDADYCYDSANFSSFINTLWESTCLKNKCLFKEEQFDFIEKVNILPQKHVIYLSYITDHMNQLHPNVGKSLQKASHLNCVIKILNIVYKQFIREYNDNDCDGLTENLISMAQSCLAQPDLLQPVPVDMDCESEKAYLRIVDNNTSVTCACLRFYFDILFTDIDDNGTMHIETSRIIALQDPTPVHRSIIKKTASKVFILACSRLGEQSWTNQKTQEVCNEALQYITLCCGYNSYSSLLSGCKGDDNIVLFNNGLFGCILSDLMPKFHKDVWRKNIPHIHAFLWCLKNVTYPHLGQYMLKLIPPLLLLTDDYITTNKLLGILSMTHLIENVNPSDLMLYNHANVIYDVLHQQLYSNECRLYEVSLKCLLKLLPVLDNKPTVINGAVCTYWDTTFLKVIDNVQLTSNVDTELVLLRFIPQFMEKMAGNTIKHIDKLVDLLNFPIQGEGTSITKKRLYSLAIISTMVKNCWPVINLYHKCIFKIVFRILIDSCMSCSKDHNKQKEIEEKVYEIFVLLKQCIGDESNDVFEPMLSIKLHAKFDAIPILIKRVMNVT